MTTNIVRSSHIRFFINVSKKNIFKWLSIWSTKTWWLPDIRYTTLCLFFTSLMYSIALLLNVSLSKGTTKLCEISSCGIEIKLAWCWPCCPRTIFFVYSKWEGLISAVGWGVWHMSSLVLAGSAIWNPCCFKHDLIKANRGQH